MRRDPPSTLQQRSEVKRPPHCNATAAFPPSPHTLPSLRGCASAQPPAAPRRRAPTPALSSGPGFQFANYAVDVTLSQQPPLNAVLTLLTQGRTQGAWLRSFIFTERGVGRELVAVATRARGRERRWRSWRELWSGNRGRAEAATYWWDRAPVII